MKSKEDKEKIAIDVKTTYRKGNGRFSFTLGGYTSFLRERNETKNIVFPFSDYKEHLVIGYVYDRQSLSKNSVNKIYNVAEYENILRPYVNVEAFVNYKWKIACDTAGSGNTTNIGSITSELSGFINGDGIFKNEEEFIDYWRNYKRTRGERKNSYNNINEYRLWKIKQL